MGSVTGVKVVLRGDFTVPLERRERFLPVCCQFTEFPLGFLDRGFKRLQSHLFDKLDCSIEIIRSLDCALYHGSILRTLVAARGFVGWSGPCRKRVERDFRLLGFRHEQRSPPAQV